MLGVIPSLIHMPRIRFSSFSYHFSCPWAQTKRQNKKNIQRLLRHGANIDFYSMPVCVFNFMYLYIYKGGTATSFLSLGQRAARMRGNNRKTQAKQTNKLEQ